MEAFRLINANTEAHREAVQHTAAAAAPLIGWEHQLAANISQLR